MGPSYNHLVITLTLCFTVSIDAVKVYDLTHSLNEDTHRWPTNIKFNLTVVANSSSGDAWYASNDLTFSEHTGTHLDAPIHFANRPGVFFASTIPPERLVGPLVLIDLADKAATNKDYLASAADIKTWESKFGEVPEKSIVVFSFGWSKYWKSYKDYFGSDSTDTTTFHFPGVDIEAAKLLEQRHIYAVGIDTPSLDYGPSQDFPVHKYLLEKNIYFLENVADTSMLPAGGKGVTLLVGAMKIDYGTGGPARLLAIVNEEFCENVGNSAVSEQHLATATLLLTLLIYSS